MAVYVMQDTQCIHYTGRHLSVDCFTQAMQLHYQRYSSYFEVHTIPLLEANLGKLLLQTPKRYLVQVDAPVVREFFLNKVGQLQAKNILMLK